jgi:antitoxin MazE
MRTLVQRWGKSLALRIPKVFAEELSVCAGDEVEMTVAGGRLLIAPHRTRNPDLADLVAQIRPGNLHKEVVAAGPRGNEVW